MSYQGPRQRSTKRRTDRSRPRSAPTAPTPASASAPSSPTSTLPAFLGGQRPPDSGTLPPFLQTDALQTDAAPATKGRALSSSIRNRLGPQLSTASNAMRVHSDPE
ncbi:MAG: hypothetical protein AAFN74_25860, partial [Myxococcota bacterium]